jgi:putative phosphoribosyl transferase
VDDGIATGSTARAACQVAWAQGATRVVLAVPVASPEALVALGGEVEIECLSVTTGLWAVGQCYEDFRQVPDAEVARLLTEADRPHLGLRDPAGISSGE